MPKYAYKAEEIILIQFATETYEAAVFLKLSFLLISAWCLTQKASKLFLTETLQLESRLKLCSKVLMEVFF